MRSLLLLFITGLLSVSSFADCRQEIQADIDTYKSNSKGLVKESLVYGAVLSPVIFYAIPPVGIFLTSVIGGSVVTYKIQAKNRAKLIEAINDAYSYIETNNETRLLKKILKKVNRYSETKKDMLTVANALIDSNENGKICEDEYKRNIRQASKLIAIDLVD